MLLPIPDRLANLADLSHSNFTNFIEIENLLPENYLKASNIVQSRLVAGVEYLKILDHKKNKLWKGLIHLEKEDFTDFQPLFNSVKTLLDSSQKQAH